VWLREVADVSGGHNDGVRVDVETGTGRAWLGA
jgi:hypothetical protein